MKCKKCSKEIERGWRFCPYCGESASLIKFNFPKFSFRSESIKDIEDDMQDMEKEMEQMLKSFGFPNIKIAFRTMNRPMQKQEEVTVQKKPVHTKMKKIERQVEKVEEPETNIKQRGSEITVTINLPDVKSAKDIVIRKFGESLEIRAYAGTKMYFKLIPVAKISKIMRESFENKVLTLIINS